jgi:hypothetical protein
LGHASGSHDDDPLLDAEPPDDPLEPDSADASELPSVDDPPQASIEESQTRDPPRIPACFE